MNDLTTIIRQNREAAKIIPGFTGVGVNHRNSSVNDRAPTEREGHTIHTNPRTGARVNVRNG